MRERINYFLRKNIDFKNRERLKQQEFSIISQNCTGGVIYHDLGLRFLSPTINLYMSQRDLIKFVNNLDYYIQLGVKEKKTEKQYPVGMLGDIELNFMHYESFEDAKINGMLGNKEL